MSPRRTPSARLIDRLELRVDEMTERMLSAIVGQIPGYREQEPEALSEVRTNVRGNIAEWLRVVRERRPPTPEELAGFASSARVRAHAGIPLDALLHAYRVGATVGWEVILEETRDGAQDDLEAALEVAGGLMRYLDHVSTDVAQSYLEEREHMVTDEEHVHRALSDLLLSEGTSSVGAEERATRAGIKLAPNYWVALFSLPVPHRTLRLVARHLRRLALAPPVLTVPREDGVLALWPANGIDVPVPLMRAHEAIEAEWGPTLIAIAGPAEDALGAVLAEARVVVAASRDRTSGVVGLKDVLLDAVIHGVGGRVPDAVLARVAPLLEHDAVHGADLARTMRVYISSDASLRETARTLVMHRNTVAYRLRRVYALTGLDPARQLDLFVLHVGLRLAETEGTREPA